VLSGPDALSGMSGFPLTCYGRAWPGVQAVPRTGEQRVARARLEISGERAAGPKQQPCELELRARQQDRLGDWPADGRESFCPRARWPCSVEHVVKFSNTVLMYCLSLLPAHIGVWALNGWLAGSRGPDQGGAR
jgi:hypothetical protein